MLMPTGRMVISAFSKQTQACTTQSAKNFAHVGLNVSHIGYI